MIFPLHSLFLLFPLTMGGECLFLVLNSLLDLAIYDLIVSAFFSVDRGIVCFYTALVPLCPLDRLLY